MTIITENMLDDWVRSNARDAQGVIVELVWRLVCASSPQPHDRRFPLADSIGQHGPDGFLDAEIAYKPYISHGKSYWEIGSGLDAGSKASSDYKDLTAATPKSVREESVFIFVTPMSGRRDWPHTWKEDAQASWLQKRCNLKEWRDVKIIDGTKLVEWMGSFPSIELWLATKMNLSGGDLENPELHWETIRSIGEPPALTPEVFMVHRQRVCEKLNNFFDGQSRQLQLDSYFPDQIIDMVSAFIFSLEKSLQKEISGRCLIVKSPAAMFSLCQIGIGTSFLIADFDMNDQDAASTKLIQQVHRAGHALIYKGSPGGIPHPNRIFVNNPKPEHLHSVLVAAGYNSGRALNLTQRSDGNIGALIRCILNLSAMPEWSQSNEAAELAIALVLGSWNETNTEDIAVIEQLSGKSYGEWIGAIRNVTQRPHTPLTHKEGAWKFIARYEGWYSLGSRLYTHELERFKNICISVLSEQDPKFASPKERRWELGYTLRYSFGLRRGLAETLALIGAKPTALTNYADKATTLAYACVTTVLENADWELWASLNDLLPLLAEAHPSAFMKAIEDSLNCNNCPFDMLFQQESSGIGGQSYITGLLWSLETLAWSRDSFSRVMLILAALAERDPGGLWSNRPKNSLTTILLPWLPQTLVDPESRKSVLKVIIRKYPKVGWILLLSLLPSSHSHSNLTRKPAWREWIADDWNDSVSHYEYWQQIKNYGEILVDCLVHDPSLIPDILYRFHELPIESQDFILGLLESESVTSLPEEARLPIWNSVIRTATKHRKLATAEWALDAHSVSRLFKLAEQIQPESLLLKHERLFGGNDYDFYEDTDDLKGQMQALSERKAAVVSDIYHQGGLQAIIQFVNTVKTPHQVGLAFGSLQIEESLNLVLPSMILSEDSAVREFVGGYIWAWYRVKGWSWVKERDFAVWDKKQISQFLTYLPFVLEAWELSENLLDESQDLYWSIANANPYDAQTDLQPAIVMLLKYNRPKEAIACLYGMLHDKKSFDPSLAITALKQALKNSNLQNTIDIFSVTKLIGHLQSCKDIKEGIIAEIEWGYLRILEEPNEVRPLALWKKLANEPSFFCELVRTIFYSNNPSDNEKRPEPSVEQKNIATNAYHLLNDWMIVPGAIDDPFNHEHFKIWLHEVKQSCKESGHFDVAMSLLGKILIHAPVDPSGLWIHSSIAEALEAPDAEHLRNGFSVAFFNSRGVYSPSGGVQERKLAEGYTAKAEAVEREGFVNVGVILREVAAGYERDAAKDEERGWFDD